MSSKKPANFQFLINEDTFKLAGMSKFDDNAFDENFDLEDEEAVRELYLYVQYLRDQGITTVISLEEDGHELTKAAVINMGLTWCSCFVEDWTAPCVDHLKQYCQLVKKHKFVATHCHGGTGRTGVFLASYLLFAGRVGNAQSALKMVRRVYNQHSVEMKAQYNALGRFSDSLGNDCSMAFDNNAFTQYEAKGDWHGSHGDDGMTGDNGMTKDPGHNGDKSDVYDRIVQRGYNIDQIMIDAEHGAHVSDQSYYVKEYKWVPQTRTRSNAVVQGGVDIRGHLEDSSDDNSSDVDSSDVDSEQEHIKKTIRAIQRMRKETRDLYNMI